MSAVRLIASCAGALAAVATVFAPASTAASGSRYTSAPYTLRTTHYAFGQAPVFMPDGRVVFGKDFKKGDKAQVYIARQNGSTPWAVPNRDPELAAERLRESGPDPFVQMRNHLGVAARTNLVAVAFQTAS